MTNFPEEPTQEAPAGAPPWVVTFADMVSLLMCFFVLMLSFSEMNTQKFKQMMGSMQDAFSVQRQIPLYEVPKGISAIYKEFSPGKPQPTVLDEIRQITTDKEQKYLDRDGSSEPVTHLIHDANKVSEQLQKEISSGDLEVETRQGQIIIRISEKASFQSGSDDLSPSFNPVLGKIKNVLKDVDGTVTVAGHTDDVPISTAHYRSNWELSTARAVSVATALINDEGIDPDRVSVVGHGDTRPEVPNDSPSNRARNRRVEIIIEHGQQAPVKPVSNRVDQTKGFVVLPPIDEVLQSR